MKVIRRSEHNLAFVHVCVYMFALLLNADSLRASLSSPRIGGVALVERVRGCEPSPSEMLNC